MLLTDALVAFRVWVCTILLFVWLPSRVFGQAAERNVVLRAGARFARMLLLTIGTVVTFAALHILNWFTLMLFCVVLLSVGWIHSFKGKIPANELWNQFLQFTGKWENIWKGKRWKHPFRWYREWEWYEFPGRDSDHSSWDYRILPVAVAGIVAAIIVVHLWWPLQQLRFPGEQGYAVLFRVRELMLDLHPIARPLVMPALLATISSLSSVNSMEVTRFVSPLLAILLALTGGIAVASCFRSNWSGLLAALILGAYGIAGPASVLAKADGGTWARGLGDSLNSALVERYAMSDNQLGAVFLFLAIAFVAEWYFESRTSLRDAGCCLVLLTIASPTLLLPAAVMGLAVFVGPCVAVLTMSLVWTALGMLPILFPRGVAAQFPSPRLLDVAVTLTIACVFALCEKLVQRLSNSRMSLAMAAVGVALLLLCMPPQLPQPKFLEYDAAARQMLRIERSYPRQHWVAIAPLEQFSQSFGLGKYEDLGEFVGHFQDDPQRRDCQYGADIPVLVFVEKRPFRTFEYEPPSVPFATLVDPTYRNYRSPAGRASLEWTALRLCEAYKQSHPDASIFYEDDDLRIYNFRSSKN